ncbi:MAG TPA: ATP-NAD kinase [Methanomicrobia archaeon]|nr:ATP-NAD kinase [Methanomicrobia archaeon]
MKTVGFLVNPIAGMGGRVGLKGTDGMLEEARRRGATPVTPQRAARFFDSLDRDVAAQARWLTCGGLMGADIMKDAGFEYDTVYAPKGGSSGADTRHACELFLERGCDLIVFCGGDGTARDVNAVVGRSVPILGIPSGVKMLSGVFAINPSAGAELLELCIAGSAETQEAEVVDLDEEEYRHDRFSFKVFGTALTLFEGNYVQSSKMLIRGAHEDDIKDDIARTVIEDMDDGTLYLLGPGSTVRSIAERLGIDNTLLGIDAVKGKELVGRDLNEERILELIEGEQTVMLILSPIGAQGFVIGRGNLQISPAVLERIGIGNILIVSTPAKLKTIRHLLVDTGDANLDKKFMEKRYLPVIIGYRTSTLKNIGIQNL